MTFTNALVWHSVSRAHGRQREMAAIPVPCAHDTPCQAKKIVNVIYGYVTKYSSDSVEIKSTEAKKCSRHTRILAVSWLCGRVCGPSWASMHTMLQSMHRIFSWLSNESFCFFNGVLCSEITSRTDARLRGTLTRTQLRIRHIFSPRPPTIHWNEASYAT